MARTAVLLVGSGGPTARRLRSHLSRRGLRVRDVPDCGAAFEVLQQLVAKGPQPARELRGAVVLDIGTAGIGARAFRELLHQQFPRLSVLELPPESAGPEDIGLLVAALQQDLRDQLEDRDGAGGGAAGFEAPLHGYKFEDLNSRNPRMLELFGLIPKVAKTDSPVLIVGETGTGKELVAAAIHRQSRRRSNEFFTLNCGALTESLLETELFGHERGAFTGAVRTKQGCFELASGGTLFLDELGTISPAMQVKLLRVLEQMEVRRVGGSELHAVDVRIVAATNSSLEDAVGEGTFREDLYYRLNVVQVLVPALRDRAEDIPLLAEVFRKKFGEVLARSDVIAFEQRAIGRLKSYAWPGNVRELQNVIERALILTKGPQIVEEDLPERIRASEARRTSIPAFDLDEPLPEVVRRVSLAVEREYIRRLLKRYKGHLGRAALHAGVNRRTLYNKMQSHGISREGYR